MGPRFQQARETVRFRSRFRLTGPCGTDDLACGNVTSYRDTDVVPGSVYADDMTRKATTFRLDPEVQAGLALLSEVQGRSQNQLVNEAVRELVLKRTRAVEVDLESTLERLRQHRLSDPTGEHSMAAAMEAEAAVEEDPAEGVRIQRSFTVGPATAGMFERLSG